MKTTIQTVLAGIAVVAVFSATNSFGAGDDTLIFSHQKHIADAGAACTDCHKEMAENTGGAKAVSPSMTGCGTCHQEELDAKNCAMCHTNSIKAKKYSKTRLHPEFSHKAHIKHGAECATCHKGMETATKTMGGKTPSMEICFTCHNNKKARQDCGLCHSDLSKIKPPSHKSVRFLKEEHGKDARFSTQECEKCHQQNWCDQCHQGQNNLKVHGPNYRYTHGIEAKRRDKKCVMCHEIQNQCTSCHAGR